MPGLSSKELCWVWANSSCALTATAPSPYSQNSYQLWLGYSFQLVGSCAMTRQLEFSAKLLMLPPLLFPPTFLFSHPRSCSSMNTASTCLALVHFLTSWKLCICPSWGAGFWEKPQLHKQSSELSGPMWAQGKPLLLMFCARPELGYYLQLEKFSSCCFQFKTL